MMNQTFVLGSILLKWRSFTLGFTFIDYLKGLAQAKIIKKSVILFRVLNMTIWCKHVHKLELQIFIIFVLRTYQLD